MASKPAIPAAVYLCILFKHYFHIIHLHLVPEEVAYQYFIYLASGRYLIQILAGKIVWRLKGNETLL